jgi:hypothetical protein
VLAYSIQGIRHINRYRIQDIHQGHGTA